MLIVAAASVPSMILALEQVRQRMAGALPSVSDARVAVVLLLDAMLLVLGTVLEGPALMIILAPVFVELTAALDLDPVHLGVVIVLNTTIGSITPPVGTVLYTVCSITRCPIEEFAREAVPFLAALAAVLLLLTLVPGLVTALPAIVLG